MLLAPLEDLKLMTQMSSRMNPTQIVRTSSRSPIFNFGVLLLTSRYVASRFLATKLKNRIKPFVAEISGESTFLRHALNSVIWASVSIPILAPFDCARTRFVAGRKHLGLKLNRSSMISVLLAIAGMSIYRILSHLLYGMSKTILKGRNTTTRFLLEFLINSVATTATYPIDTLRRMYFLESHAIKGLTSNMLLRGVWINLIRCFTQALLLLLMRKQFYNKKNTRKKVTFNPNPARHRRSSPPPPSSPPTNDEKFKTPRNKQPWRRRGRRVAQT